jgi:nucleoside-diphosphate-sugar epimerase
MIHGPNNKGNLNLLFKWVASGFPYPLGAFKNQRSYLGIEHLCNIIANLIENDKVPSGTYHLADDGFISTRELIELICLETNRKPRIWNISTIIIRTLAKLGDFFKLPLNSERLTKLIGDYKVSNKKINNALGNSAIFDVKQSLKTTIQSFGNR